MISLPALFSKRPAPAAGGVIAATPAPAPSAPAAPRGRAFAWGEAEPVTDRREFLLHAQALWNGRWWEPPIPMLSLARTRHMSPHHASALKYKVNQLVRFFHPSRWLTRGEFGKLALDYLSLGNGYLQRFDNLAGRPLAFRSAPAVWTRVGADDVYWWVAPSQFGVGAGTLGDGAGGPNGAGLRGGSWGIGVPFERGTVVQLLEPDLLQEVYGLPEYLSALQAGLLNEQATIFRRRYYQNGSHMGYILYVNEATFTEADAEELEQALDQSKGPGNFKNMLLHLPGGKEKGVQMIPVGEASAKDEFLGIKNTTRDDVLAAHRVPPVLIGVVPQVTGGFGRPGEAADVFHHAEIEPLQMRMLELNDLTGLPLVAFDPYTPQAVAPAPAGGGGSGGR